MRNFLNWFRETNLVFLSLEIGLALWILVSFVRCSVED